MVVNKTDLVKLYVSCAAMLRLNDFAEITVEVVVMSGEQLHILVVKQIATKFLVKRQKASKVNSFCLKTAE